MSREGPSIQLVDEQRLLTLFAQGISGRYFHLKVAREPAEGSRVAPLELPPSAGDVIELPERADAFPEPRANFGVYRVALLHQIGFFEFGAYDFAFAEVCLRVPGLESEDSLTPPHPTDLERFFACFPRPGLARSAFTLVEGTRIDCALPRAYPGLRGDLSRVFARELAERGPLDRISDAIGLLEAVIRLSLDADPGPLLRCDTTGELAPLLAGLERVRAPGSDVYDSAAVTRLLVETLLRVGAGSLSSGVSADPGKASEAGDGGAWRELESRASVSFRGDPALEIVQRRMRVELAESALEALRQGGTHLSPEVLQRLLEGARLELRRGSPGRAGLAAGEREAPISEEVRRALADELTRRCASDRALLRRVVGEPDARARSFLYDEWDYQNRVYLRGWCRLFEQTLRGEEGRAFLEEVRHRHRVLFGRVRSQFQHIQPETRRRVGGVVDGDEIDLERALAAHVDRRAGHAPGDRVYSRRERIGREVAAAFLVDLSASVSEPVRDPEAEAPAAAADEDLDDPYDPPPVTEPKRRIVDIEKEALALMVEALQTLGDEYGIYGFSGSGREQVEFYVAKDFDQVLGPRVWNAIAAMRPRRSTRMGPAIRHSVGKLSRQDARRKLLILISDGFPQDSDYGPDGYDREYGIQDTAQALREAEQSGIQTFCVTIDRAGYDYLRRMCPDEKYLVIDEVESLPAELGKIYRTLRRLS